MSLQHRLEASVQPNTYIMADYISKLIPGIPFLVQYPTVHWRSHFDVGHFGSGSHFSAAERQPH